jgi:hypothetical protein
VRDHLARRSAVWLTFAALKQSAMPSGGVSAGPLGHDVRSYPAFIRLCSKPDLRLVLEARRVSCSAQAVHSRDALPSQNRYATPLRSLPLYISNLSPRTSAGNSNCYGIRVHPVQNAQSSGASIRSSMAMNSSYVIWRKWEDCLWFQDIVELQYSILSRQKRQRLLSGKGVKKNGVYIHDHASSWESLPPGPDPKSVKKDVHDYLPRLTKRGTLFRTSASTIDQRHAELTALVEAFLSEDVPALVEELRQDRLIRDFFGFWRRDHDLLLKHNPPRRPGLEKPRKSFIAGIGAWSASFAASTPDISVRLPPSPPPSASIPPSPTQSTSSSVLASSDSGSSTSGSSINGDMLSFAQTNKSSLSTVRGTPSRSAPTEASFTSSRSRLVPNMNVTTIPPPCDRSDLLSQTRSTITSSSRPRSNSAPKPKTYNVSQDFPLFLSSSTRDPSSRPAPPGTTRTRVGGLEALPEEQEHDLGGAASGVGLVDTGLPDPPLTPLMQRRRAQSLAAASHRAVVVCNDTFSQPDAASDVFDAHDASSAEHEGDADPGLSSSSATLSTASLESRRSSWRTGLRSRPSSAESAASEIDAGLSGFSSAPPSAELRPQYRHHPKAASISSVGSADGIIPGRVSVPPSMLRGRPRSNSQPLPSGVDESGEIVDSWIELGDDFMDAYFNGPAQSGDLDIGHEDDELVQEAIAPACALDVPYTAVPSSPHSPSGQTVFLPTANPDVPQSAIPPTPAPPLPFNKRRQNVTISLSPDLFAQSFHDDTGFGLPFTPPPHTPELPAFPASPARPTFLATPPPDDSFVIKAARDDAIVSFRLPRAATLADARARVADKFVHTEGVALAPCFALAYVPPVSGRASARETPVRGSTASAATADWSRQSLIVCDEDWAVAIATCGHKLVLRVAEPAAA